MESIKKLKKLGLFLGLIFIVIGVVFFAFPDKVVEILALIIGIGILVYGGGKAFGLAFSWKSQDNSMASKIFSLVVDSALIFLGIYLLINNNVTISAVGLVIGLFALLSAFDRFSVAVQRIKLKLRVMPTIIFGIIHLLFGIGMIYAAISMLSAIIMMAGLYLIVSGIMIILSTCYFFDFK